MKTHNRILKMVLSALFLTLAYVLPFLTGQLREIGNMLCPMHIPVLLCGFICGWQWGISIGFIAPLFRSLTLGMPVLYPYAICMAIELAAYGALSGVMYKYLPKKKVYIYLSLALSMLLGRLAWGAAMTVTLGLIGNKFTLFAFWTGAFAKALPGIVLQIVFVPLIVMLFEGLKIFETERQ